MADQQRAEADTEDSLQPSPAQPSHQPILHQPILHQPSHQPVLAAFGNPLLDIIVGDETGEVVNMFGLEKDIAQEVDTIGSGLFELATQRPDIEYSGGGCALNTVRVFQWLSGVRHDSMFLGGLGTDASGAMLQSLVEKDGVRTVFARQPGLATGHCIALVRGHERTLCANLGAANKYETADLAPHKDTLLRNTKVIYVEGYFLPHSPDAALELARFAQKHKITFVFNLCGEYVCEDITYVENVLAILPFIDILFGNLSEFEVFIDTIEAKLDTSSSVIRNLRAMIRSEGVDALYMKIENICESPVRSKPKSLIAVVTEGCEPVQCYSIGERLKTISVEVPRLPQAAVKDTIGAGDSFIAGFIFVLLREGSLRSCIEYAIWTAQKMIQQVGVTLPKSKPEPPLLPLVKKGMKRSASCSQDSNPIGPVVPNERAKIRS